MSTRRKTRGTANAAIDPSLVMKALVAVGGIWLLIQILTKAGGALAVILLLLGGGFLWLSSDRKRKRYQRLGEQIEAHKSALISAFLQNRRADGFGNVDESRWNREVDTFLRTQVVSDVRDFDRWRQSGRGVAFADQVRQTTAELVALKRQTDPETVVDAATLTPTEYEHHCANLLGRLGWNLQITKPTRDSGADFVAQREGVRLVVQCKRYAQPVGNGAVQEVHAARVLYSGTHACVVAPSGFTAQARAEAVGLSVRLVHHSALAELADKIAMEASVN